MNITLSIIGWTLLVCSWTVPFLVSDKKNRRIVGMVLSGAAVLLFLIALMVK